LSLSAFEKKTSQVVITTIGDRYAADDKATVIVGLGGQQVFYLDFIVPCDARLHHSYHFLIDGRSCFDIYAS
jgi:hypothetical protein